MDLLILNKKRKKLAIISISVTLLIVALYVFASILFGAVSFLFPLLGFFIVLALLYLFSSTYVMKQYFILKASIIDKCLQKDLKCKEIKALNSKDEYIYNFFSKNSVTIKSRLDIIYELNSIQAEEFEITEKRDFKSNKVVLAGKHFKVNLNNCNDVVFIKNFDDQTEKFINYYSYLFKNKDDNVSVDNKKRYVCLYNDKPSLDILNIFEKIGGFHMIAIKDNVADIIFIDDTPIFDFKIQHKITDNTINNCKSCFNKTIKLLTAIRKEGMKNV